MSSRLLVFCVCLAALLSFAGPAAAVKLDRSFGRDGVLGLRLESGPTVGAYATALAPSPRGDIYVLQEPYICTGRTCASSSLARLEPDGERDLAFAGDGSFDLPVGSGPVRGLAADRFGRALVGLAGAGQRLRLMRIGRDGALDRSFGNDGRATLPCDCLRVQILPQPSGGMLVVTSRRAELRPKRWSEVVSVSRLKENGEVDAAYGIKGETTVEIAEASGGSNATLLAGGGVAFAGEGSKRAGPWVARIGSRGRLDRASLRRTRRLARAFFRGEDSPYVGGLAARPGGGVDLFGGRGARGFMLRLGPDGDPERGFGRGGFKSFPRPIANVVGTPSGRSFVIAVKLEEEDWYSEYGLFSAWLDRRGRLLQGFDRSRGSVRWANPFGGLTLQGGRWPLLFDYGYSEGCRSDCLPYSTVYRFAAA